MQQIVKASNKKRDWFAHIFATFPRLSDKKEKASVFDHPQIRKFIKDEKFPLYMTEVGNNAWDAFVKVTKNSLGIKRARSS